MPQKAAVRAENVKAVTVRAESVKAVIVRTRIVRAKTMEKNLGKAVNYDLKSRWHYEDI